MRRVLICLRYGIGDLVMELPALRHLRREWPNAHLTALGAWPAVELLEGDRIVDELVRVQDLGFEHWWDPGTEAARQRAEDWFGQGEFDLVLDGEHAVAGIRRMLENAGLPVLNTGNHVEVGEGRAGGWGVQSIWNSALQAWGLARPYYRPAPKLCIPERFRQLAREFLLARWGPEREVIGIAPVASSPLKRWPMARVSELIRQLTVQRDCRVLVFGVAPEDPAGAEHLRHAAPSEHLELVPPLHLQHTAALIEHCRALLGNDTGLMHMAAALGVATVAIFGPTSPGVALPEGATAVESGVACRHRPTDRFGPGACMLEERCLVGEQGCIAAVSVAAVVRALYAALVELPRERSGEYGP
ncbi:MAG TPA: glycosyltransferase family 9 protein [Nitrococcus sp.]|nr:glycosyltransferase family 9 protein [Nitrococcus sp.]